MDSIAIRNAICVNLLLIPLPCLGWGADGHRIVGKIGERCLTSEARAWVDELLAGQSLAEVSTWADEIKSDDSWNWARPSHYANVPTDATGFDLTRDCPERGCVVRAILEYGDVLRDESATMPERAEALRFLVHFVGDIHQPLHVSRAEDRGGNSIDVRFFGRDTNLHRTWDTHLIEHTQKEWRSYADELLGSIPPQRRTEWESTNDPIDWANESYALAISHAYPIPADGMLGDDYFERNISIVQERLAMGGVRLATLLNGIAAGGTGSSAEADGMNRPLAFAAVLVGIALVLSLRRALRPHTRRPAGTDDADTESK